MDLANLSNLLERGADKISEALPRVFTKRSQTRVLLGGGKKMGVGWEVGLEEGGKIEIKRQVVAYLVRGEVGIIPVEMIFFDLELNWM
jgi:hypothetical protein